MTNNTDVCSIDESERRIYKEIRNLFCLLSAICTWRLLNDLAFPALGHGANFLTKMILG